MKRKGLSILLALTLLMTITAPITPAYALASLQDYFSGRLNYSYKVYSGPGTDYYRANSGKAQYGRGGVARIYGTESNGWVLIGYELGSGDYRIGYVEPAAVNNIYDYDESNTPDSLYFDYSAATITSTCALTDDPVINQKTVVTLQKGTACTFLATFGGTWDYIEVDTTSGTMRGFVHSANVSFGGSPSGGTTPVYPAGDHAGIDEFYNLSYLKGRFAKSYDVYQGPGDWYYRANKGKATLGGGGVCRVYGTDGNWLLIGYETADGDYRIGYITDYVLPDNISYFSIDELSYAYTDTYITERTKVTDDPVNNMKALETLDAGTRVSFLAWASTKHNYALIEYYSPTYQQMVRAFVRGKYLNGI